MYELLKEILRVFGMWITLPVRLVWEVFHYTRLVRWTNRNNLRVLDFIPGVGYVISLADKPWPVALGETARPLLKYLKKNRTQILASIAELETESGWDRPSTGSNYIRVGTDKSIPVDWKVKHGVSDS